MKRFTSHLLLNLLIIFTSAASPTLGQVIQDSVAPSSDLLELQKLKEEIDSVLHRLETVEARATDHVILNEKVQWIERELTNSLMNISNFLDMGDMNMDAAHAAIEASQSAVSASEAYLSMGNFAATVVAILVALATIGASISMETTNRRIRNVASSAADDIIKEFVSSSSDAPNHGTRKVLEAVRESVKQDLEETPALLMQNDEFKKMLTRLVDAAVVTTLSKRAGDEAPKDATSKTLDEDDFAK